MKNVKHSTSNKRAIPPKNWDDRGGALQLEAIDVTQGSLHGVDVFVSWWKPTEDDLMCLLRGGQVQLTCVGGQPAVSLCGVEEQGQVPRILLPH
jgi:hypothetical protein